KKELFIGDSEGSFLELAVTSRQPFIEIVFKKVKGKQKESETVDLSEFIAVKGMKAQGNQLTKDPVRQINIIEQEEDQEPETSDEENESSDPQDDNGDNSQIILEL
ncbi:MAG: DNA gyrase/topoisomerase IV subunit A, partial [Owenweeksia sp.]